MVEERLIEVTLQSARNLKDVNYLSKMETYAVFKFAPYVEYTTQVDHNNGLNPNWNEKLGFMIPESVLQRGEGHLHVEIFTLSTLGPKFVCEASIPLIEISRLGRLNEPFAKRYPLKTSSGDFHGELSISFTVKDKVFLQSSGQEPSFPIFRPMYDSTSRPSALTNGNPSKPSSTLHQPTNPPLVSPILIQPPHDPMSLSHLSPPRAYGHATLPQQTPGQIAYSKPTPGQIAYSQPTPGQIAYSQPATVQTTYSQSTRPPSLGQQYEYMPLSKPATSLGPPTNYSEGPLAHSPYMVTTRPPPPSGPPLANFPQQPSKFGPSQGMIKVPIARTDEGGYGPGSGYGNLNVGGYGPGSATGGYGNGANPLFGGPLGKVLLTDLSSSRPFASR